MKALFFVAGLVSAMTLLFSVSTSSANARETQTLRSGDIVSVSLPGEPAFDAPFQVGRDGTMVLPEIGPVQVEGLSVIAAKTLIRESLTSVFRDLSNLEVSIAERRLMVQVLGFVNKPGTVDLDYDANVQTALEAAQGLRPGAQLDRMQLRRNGNTEVFNFKEYLDTGSIAGLPAREPMDVIFVPASPLIGNVEVAFHAQTLASVGDSADDESAIRVFGEVQKPGSYSFKPAQNLVDVIMRAGGVTRYAGVEKIRIMADGEPAVFSLKDYLDSGDQSLMPEVVPGATIFVPIAEEDVKASARTVYVMGEVPKPGAFEMTDGATFFDVLANAGGPSRFADTRALRLIRANGEVIGFDLTGFTEGRGAGNVPVVQPGDAIFVPEKADQTEKSWLKVAPGRAIRIVGEVERPGRYEWSNEMSLLDLMAHAGGARRSGDISKIEILKKDGGNAHPVVFNLREFMTKGGHFTDLPKLHAGDTINVPSLPPDPGGNKSQWLKQSSDRSIYVMGSVGTPGRYAFSEEMHFLDILSAADGPRQDADIQSIRITHRGSSEAKVTPLNLALYFETGDEGLLPEVRPGDVIYVPSRNREWTQLGSKQTVRVLGAVANPGRYTFDDDMTILDLLAEAGGPTGAAWQESIVVANLVDGEPRAQSFDLVAFARSGDFSRLPVVRAGDTIYVPNIEQSDWHIFMSGVRDVVSLISIVALIGVL